MYIFFKVLDDIQIITQDTKESCRHGRTWCLCGNAVMFGYMQNLSPYSLQLEHLGSPSQLQTALSHVLLTLIMDFSGMSQKAIECIFWLFSPF